MSPCVNLSSLCVSCALSLAVLMLICSPIQACFIYFFSFLKIPVCFLPEREQEKIYEWNGVLLKVDIFSAFWLWNEISPTHLNSNVDLVLEVLVELSH